MLDDLSLFDEEIAYVLERNPPPDFESMDVATARSAFRGYFKQAAQRGAVNRDGVFVEDVSAPSLIDDWSIPIRVYRPRGSLPKSGLLYMHGGGFYVGDLDSEDDSCYALARDAGCVVISVDYRLAPENRFPVPLEDCYSAMQWAVENAEELSFDRARFGVVGCSAGAALAAGIDQLSLDRRGYRPAMQMLLYPVLDASLSTPSMTMRPDRGRNILGPIWERYIGHLGPVVPEYASPSNRRLLSGLAPAYIVAAEFDPLRDEAIAYAQALWNAGVKAELHVWPRVPHAFELVVPEATIARRAIQEQADAVFRFIG